MMKLWRKDGDREKDLSPENSVVGSEGAEAIDPMWISVQGRLARAIPERRWQPELDEEDLTIAEPLEI